MYYYTLASGQHDTECIICVQWQYSSDLWSHYKYIILLYVSCKRGQAGWSLWVYKLREYTIPYFLYLFAIEVVWWLLYTCTIVFKRACKVLAFALADVKDSTLCAASWIIPTFVWCHCAMTLWADYNTTYSRVCWTTSWQQCHPFPA